MSLYAEAVNEKYGFSVYEDDNGFFAYRIIEKQLYIEEFFISEKVRSEKKGKEFLNVMIELAKSFNCEKVVISIYMYVKNDLRDATLFIAMRNKFRLLRSSESHIYLERGL
jgi:hypothetical protein